MAQYYYSTVTGETYSDDQMDGLFGIDTETFSLEVINDLEFYPVQPSEPDFDTTLYTPSFTWSLVAITGGQGAERVYTATPKTLSVAQTAGEGTLKEQTVAATTTFITNLGYSPGLLAGVAAELVGNRPARFQSALETVFDYAELLDTKLTLVTAATTVDEINNIVNPPTGTINLYRTNEDLEPATFSAFASQTLTEAGTELFVPGTSTVIAWSGTDFPQTAAAFNVGDYVIQLRQVANGLVIEEFEVTTTATDYDF